VEIWSNKHISATDSAWFKELFTIVEFPASHSPFIQWLREMGVCFGDPNTYDEDYQV
jgi:hypothetical protein